MDVKISICIPTWEQHGYGKIYLKEMFDTIKSQTFKDFEVVISDHSIDNSIIEVVKEYDNLFTIRYFKNENKRGNGPANTNNALRYATGEIVKIMFQDDLFVNVEALHKIDECFEEGCQWLVNGCNHTHDGKNFYREMIPSWNDRILVGENSISSPSVLSFINKDILFFDEELVMLMDCEYYYQLYKKYGLPFILKDILVSNRTHSNQVSMRYQQDINEEIRYAINKHQW